MYSYYYSLLTIVFSCDFEMMSYFENYVIKKTITNNLIIITSVGSIVNNCHWFYLHSNISTQIGLTNALNIHKDNVRSYIFQQILSFCPACPRINPKADLHQAECRSHNTHQKLVILGQRFDIRCSLVEQDAVTYLLELFLCFYRYPPCYSLRICFITKQILCIYQHFL